MHDSGPSHRRLQSNTLVGRAAELGALGVVVQKIRFQPANDYFRHPRLRRPVPWRTASGAGYAICEAAVGPHSWAIRLNEFPDQPCHTLLIDGDEVLHFDDWPWFWHRPPLPEKTHACSENARTNGKQTTA